MKQFVCILLLMFVLVQSASATEIANTVPENTEAAVVTEPAEVDEEPSRRPDQCGENAFWSLSGGTLTISGTGGTDDFSAGTPWADSRGSITALVIEDGITYLGAAAFANCDNLTNVDFGSTLREVGTGAFRSCDGLTEISLPASFRVFGEESFYSCAGLKSISFGGGMPSFRLNCLWDTYADLIFPAKNPWPLEHIIQLEESFQGRIEFLASDGTDPYVPEEEAQQTEAATEPTVETTEATTEPTTAPTTAPTVVTEPQTIPTEATEPETTAPAVTETQPEKPQRASGGGVGLAIVLCIVSLGLIVVLVAGKLRSGGKYSR